MAEIMEIEGIGAAAVSPKKTVIVPKDKTITCGKACKLTVPKGTVLTSPKGTIYAADKKTTVKVVKDTKVKVPSAVTKSFTAEEAQYGAQEYERWTGKKITPEAYAKAINKKIVTEEEAAAEEEAAEAAVTFPAAFKKAVVTMPTKAAALLPQSVKDAWNSSIIAMRNAMASVTGLKVARANAEAVWNLLQSVAPSQTDPAWIAKYNTLAAEHAKLVKDTEEALGEANSQTKKFKDELEAAKVPAEVGAPLPVLAWVGIAAGIFAAVMALVTRWRNAQSAYQAALAEAKLQENQQELIKQKERANVVCSTELSNIDSQLATLEKQYADTGDPALLEQISALKARRDTLIDTLTQPAPILPGAAAPTEAAAAKAAEEKSWMEKIFGISPNAIVAVVVIGFLIWAAPRIAQTVKTITK